MSGPTPDEAADQMRLGVQQARRIIDQLTAERDALRAELDQARAREARTHSLVGQMERAARGLNPEGQSFVEEWADALLADPVEAPQEGDNRALAGAAAPQPPETTS